MKVLLDIKENKSAFFMEVLKNFTYVKAKPITPEKAQILSDLKDSVEYLNLVKQGKAKARDVNDLLNEL